MFLFEIYGDPVPQKQTRFGKFRAYDPSSKDKERIQWQGKPYAPAQPLTGPVKLDITFYLPIPKATSSIRKRQMINGIILPIKRPDVDNLAYIITNAFKKIFYEDDSQIVRQIVTKFYGEHPKTVVKIVPIDTLSPPINQLCD